MEEGNNSKSNEWDFDEGKFDSWPKQALALLSSPYLWMGVCIGLIFGYAVGNYLTHHIFADNDKALLQKLLDHIF